MTGDVFVGVPTRGLVDPRVIAAVSDLAGAWGVQPVYESGHLSAGMTRNLLVRRFLNTSATVIVMVDDDVVPNDADALIHPIQTGEWDVVAASYPIFNQELWPLPFPPAFRDIGGEFEAVHGDGLVECDAVGTGCVAIHRRVLEHLTVPFAETMNIDGDSIVSDDSVFCKRARDAGFRIAMNFDIRCDHFCRVSLGAILNGISVLQKV